MSRHRPFVATVLLFAGLAAAPAAAAPPPMILAVPAAPVITEPVEGIYIASDQVRVAGRSEPAASVRVWEGAVLIGTTTADVGGNWWLNGTFAEGMHSVTADQTTMSGTSPLSDPPRTFTIDLTAPPAPVIDSPVQDAEIQNATITFTGTSEPRSIVIVFEGTAARCNGRASLTGTWSCEASFGAGIHVVTAVALDVAANRGPESAARRFVVIPPAIPEILTPAEGAFTGRRVLVTGTAPAGAFVRLYEGNTTESRLGTATTSSGGNWAITLTFVPGPHSITARSFANGVEGDASEVRSFVVDDVAPAIEITDPSGLPLLAIGEPDNFRIDVAGTAADTGSGVASVRLTIVDLLGGILGTLIYDASGTFDAACSACPGANVDWFYRTFAYPGLYEVEAIATDRAGNASVASVLILKP